MNASTKQSLERFTVKGTEELENALSLFAEKCAKACRDIFPEKTYRALIMLGGYGRGEGGVEFRDGHAYAHNNIDLLLVTNAMSSRKRAKAAAELSNAIAPLAQDAHIAVDVSAVNAATIASAPCTVMWYDMRHGHKTLCGDSEFIPSLTHFSRVNILPFDIIRLMVNRGTLLLINVTTCDYHTDIEPYRRTLIKHIMKAIIGYGDALLFFHDSYHWSYAQKQINMKNALQIPDEIRTLYDMAIEFRFSPDYSLYKEKDIAAWSHELLTHFEPIHLWCEQKRLKNEKLNWDIYPSVACRATPALETYSVRQFAKVIRNTLRTSVPPGMKGFATRIHAKAMGMHGLLPVFFPAIAYPIHAKEYTRNAATLLQAQSNTPHDLRRAYLAWWKRIGDMHFAKIAEQLNISFTQETSQ